MSITNLLVSLVIMASQSGSYVGTGVVDGDTFETVDGRVVRVLNINTPELGTEDGKKAYYYARRLLNKKSVKLLPEGRAKGKYGRDLYHVILPDGSSFGERMIRRGHSRYYTKYGRSKLYDYAYRKAQQEAMDERLGIWKRLNIKKRTKVSANK